MKFVYGLAIAMCNFFGIVVLFRLSKKIYFINKFAIFKNDYRKTWSTINEVLKSTESIVSNNVVLILTF